MWPPPRIAKTPHLLLRFHDENPPCGNPGLDPEGNSSAESMIIAKSADAVRATKVNGAAGQISAWATCRDAMVGILSGAAAFRAPSSWLGGHLFSRPRPGRQPGAPALQEARNSARPLSAGRHFANTRRHFAGLRFAPAAFRRVPVFTGGISPGSSFRRAPSSGLSGRASLKLISGRSSPGRRPGRPRF